MLNRFARMTLNGQDSETQSNIAQPPTEQNMKQLPIPLGESSQRFETSLPQTTVTPQSQGSKSSGTGLGKENKLRFSAMLGDSENPYVTPEPRNWLNSPGYSMQKNPL